MLIGLINEECGQRLSELAAEIPDGQAIVELGSFKGKSTCYLASGARPGVLVHAFDAWDLPENRESPRHHFTDPETRRIFDKQVADSGMGERIVATRMLSTDAGAVWEGPPVGLLFIDADHHYESVRDDFNAWIGHVVGAGIVAFDDYRTRRNPGVERFVDELRAHTRGDWDMATQPLAIWHRA